MGSGRCCCTGNENVFPPRGKLPEVTVAEGLKRFVDFAFFFLAALASARLILDSSFESLATGFASYWRTVSHPPSDVSAIRISLFRRFNCSQESFTSSRTYSCLLFSTAQSTWLMVSCNSELNSCWILLLSYRHFSSCSVFNFLTSERTESEFPRISSFRELISLFCSRTSTKSSLIELFRSMFSCEAHSSPDRVVIFKCKFTQCKLTHVSLSQSQCWMTEQSYSATR